jgi:DNA-binding response OmpR family regulator
MAVLTDLDVDLIRDIDLCHIMRLRAKIEEEPHRPRHIKTVRGYGYQLQA